jgi:hypothetical protein
MKKVLAVAALASVLAGSSLAATVPAFADQMSGQSATMSMDGGMKAAVDKLHDQMSNMTMSGNTDKDYMSTMKMLGDAMRSITREEMKSGKDAKAKATAKTVYDRLFTNGATVNGITIW